MSRFEYSELASRRELRILFVRFMVDFGRSQLQKFRFLIKKIDFTSFDQGVFKGFSLARWLLLTESETQISPYPVLNTIEFFNPS